MSDRPTMEAIARLVPHGARVLDLFAGTGALGLEALSRGAARVAVVDDGVAARALLRANIEKMQAMGETDVWRRDATRMGPNRGPGARSSNTAGKGRGSSAPCGLRTGPFWRLLSKRREA